MAKTILAGAGALAALLLAVPAVAQDAAAGAGMTDPATWDSDAGGSLSRDEFVAGFGGMGAFGRWDANADGFVDADEFSAGYGMSGGTAPDMTAWDADGDGRLSQEEFDAGVFTSYDADASGSIEAAEQSTFSTDFGAEGTWGMGMDEAGMGTEAGDATDSAAGSGG